MTYAPYVFARKPAAQSQEMKTIDAAIFESIGRTPLLRLDRIAAGLEGVELHGKAEWHNPGGSIKDRPAARMVRQALADGRLSGGRRLLDATSGNTGIAYAMLGVHLGFGVTLTMPADASPERHRILEAYGAELVLTPPEKGGDGARDKAVELLQAEPGRFWYADQYSNPDNWKAHFESTAPEIIEQTGGRITHFVGPLGTTGTFTGVGRRLGQDLPKVRRIGLQPDSPIHKIEGLKHLATARVPAIFDPSVVDEYREVRTEQAWRMVKRLAREEGLLVGVSAAACVHAALELGKELSARGEQGLIVTVFPDNASKYLSEPFWGEDR